MVIFSGRISRKVCFRVAESVENGVGMYMEKYEDIRRWVVSNKELVGTFFRGYTKLTLDIN